MLGHHFATFLLWLTLLSEVFWFQFISILNGDSFRANDVFADRFRELLFELTFVCSRTEVCDDLFDGPSFLILLDILVTNLFDRVNELLLEIELVLMTLWAPLLFKINLIAVVHWAEFNHPLNTHIYHVPHVFLRNDPELVWTCAIMRPRPHLAIGILLGVQPLILEVEHVHLSAMHVLLADVGANDHAEEWHVVAFEGLLEHWVGLQVHVGGIDSEHGVAMIPSKYLDLIHHTLLHDAHLFNGTYLAILAPITQIRTWFSGIYPADNDVLDSVVSAPDQNIRIIYLSCEHPYDLVLREVGMDVHKYLYLECKVDPVRLLLPGQELLARH